MEKNKMSRLLRRTVRCVVFMLMGTTLVLKTGVAQTVSIEDREVQIRQACIQLWESYTSQITYTAGDELWLGGLSDKAQFVKYGYTLECLGCRWLQNPCGNPRNHWEDCRARIEEFMCKDEE